MAQHKDFIFDSKFVSYLIACTGMHVHVLVQLAKSQMKMIKEEGVECTCTSCTMYMYIQEHYYAANMLFHGFC